MAITPKRIIPGSALTTSYATYYTVPASVLTTTMKQLLLCNQDTVPRTVFLAIIPSGESTTPAASNIVLNSVSLQANETKIFGLTDVMPTGMFIRAKAGEAGGGNLVSITASGMENT